MVDLDFTNSFHQPTLEFLACVPSDVDVNSTSAMNKDF